MTFERTQDMELIRKIMTEPHIYPWLGEDSAPPPEDYRPVAHDQLIYLLVEDESVILGLFVFHPKSSICCEVHTCLLPVAWRKLTRPAAIDAQEWIWDNTTYRRIITSVPEYNRLALKLALDAGFTEYGRNPDCWMKHGKAQTVILLGVTCPR